MSSSIVEKITGRGCPVRGNDIDTDRIIPARFMKVVTFDGLGEHLFEDARKQADGKHAVDDKRFKGASVLIAEKNFGCGSSREHAPQALMRFGFKAFIAQSFAEIFAGNCCALGLPAVCLSKDDNKALANAVELNPELEVTVDLVAQEVRCGEAVYPASIPEGVRKQLLEGTWDATAVLLEAGGDIETKASSIPYVQGF
jgi:3-isopropylmalate/(R)-2-methylmalate dehydratase small subunit